MIKIREANFQESEYLQRLQSQAPQGQSLVVSTINIPDFFSRARTYDSWRVFNAYENNSIIGSAACAVRDAVLGNSVHRVGYEFQYFTSPKYRRRQVAQKLRDRIENHLRDQNAVLSYGLIMEGNVPSMRLLEREGFHLHRKLVMPSLIVKKEFPIPEAEYIRTMTPDDLEVVAGLINHTWQGHDLFEPISADSLSCKIERLENFDYSNVFIFEKEGRILSCAALWDWSKIMKITVLRFSLRMQILLKFLALTRILPQSPKSGDVIRQMMLTMIGYTSPSVLSPLVKYANNVALREGVEQLFCISQIDSKISESMKGFIKINTTINLFIKPLQSNIAMTDSPVAITGFDM